MAPVKRKKIKFSIENLIERFPHVATQIFEQVDDKSLTNCREVSKTWMEFVDERNRCCTRILNIPKVPRYEETYLLLAAKTGQTEIFREIIEQEEDTNCKDFSNNTPFHHVCRKGHFAIVEWLLAKDCWFQYR